MIITRAFTWKAEPLPNPNTIFILILRVGRASLFHQYILKELQTKNLLGSEFSSYKIE